MRRSRRSTFLPLAITGALAGLLAGSVPAALGAASASAATTAAGSPAAAPPDGSVLPAGMRPVPAGSYHPLPVGDPGLPETRTAKALAPGVTLTHIVRGTVPAASGAVNTTLDGPFIVNVVTINPRVAKGHLRVVRGRYLTDRDTVGQLVTQAHGLAGVNASFFDINDNYGVTDGLDIIDGRLVGNPDGEDGGTGVANGKTSAAIVNSATGRLLLNGTYSWSGTVANEATGQSLDLTEIDKKPHVPSACATLTDQTQCTVPGDLVRFDPVWGAQTPSGDGAEAVLDARGDVVSVHDTRGVALKPGQTSVQATGSDAAALLNLVQGGGRLKVTTQLLDNGSPVRLAPALSAVTSSWIQVNDGVNEYPYPGGTDAPASRNPLTAVATTRNGDIILFTVEGRATFSVGMSYPEESAALIDLGAYNAVNLDGGGSTQLFAQGNYATTSSDGYVTGSSGGTTWNGTSRADGDALVWVP